MHLRTGTFVLSFPLPFPCGDNEMYFKKACYPTTVGVKSEAVNLVQYGGPRDPVVEFLAWRPYPPLAAVILRAMEQGRKHGVCERKRPTGMVVSILWYCDTNFTAGVAFKSLPRALPL
jgi:hypothetical protein